MGEGGGGRRSRPHEAAEQGPAALAAKVSAIRAALTREGEAAR